MTLTYGELCAGYGGLFEGVRSVLGGDLAWYSEFDPAPSKVMAHRHPDVPNIGDMTKVDWHSVPRVDVLAGGYPCQPFSQAGKRAGENDDRHLWPNIAEAVAILRPGLCVFENVRGHLSLGFDGVLRDLKQLNYSVRWYTLRAADVGAAHGRARLFIFAEDRNEHRVCSRADRRRGMDRDHESLTWRDLRDQPQGQHVRQGQAGIGGAGGSLWGEGRGRRGCDGNPTQHAPLAADGEGGGGGTQAPGAAPAHQGSALPDRTRARGDGRGRSDRTRRGEEVERGNERAGCDAPVADQGGEPARTRPQSADVAGRASGSDLQPRLVVGAGRRPVRPGGVPGPTAGVRSDGCWACVRDTLMERAAGVIADTDATPANAGGIGGLEAFQHDGRGASLGDGAGVPHQPDRDALRVGPERDLTLLPTPVSDNSRGLPSSGTDYASLPNAVAELLPTPTSADANIEARNNTRHKWGDYAAAIARWEHVLGRPAPEPTSPGKSGPRLSPAFVEWLMGLPAGHVTDVGITRNEQLKALGNGVVPAQSAAATRAFLADMESAR